MKTHLLIITALFLLVPPPEWAETNAAPRLTENKVNRDLVKIAAGQICGYDKGDPRGGDDGKTP